ATQMLTLPRTKDSMPMIAINVRNRIQFIQFTRKLVVSLVLGIISRVELHSKPQLMAVAWVRFTQLEYKDRSIVTDVKQLLDPISGDTCALVRPWSSRWHRAVSRP